MLMFYIIFNIFSVIGLFPVSLDASVFLSSFNPFHSDGFAHVDRISMELAFLYFKRLQIEIVMHFPDLHCLPSICFPVTRMKRVEQAYNVSDNRITRVDLK